MALARRLEAHELLEFRRLAVVLYNKNRKWEESISLSKRDKLFQDAILTAAESGEEEVAEEVLNYFVDIGSKECFAATLYLCYNLLRADVVDELSWTNGLKSVPPPLFLLPAVLLEWLTRLFLSFFLSFRSDFSYPYKLQAARDHHTSVTKLKAEIEQLKLAKPKQNVEDEGPILNPAFNRTLMIGNGGGMPPQQFVNPQATGWGGAGF